MDEISKEKADTERSAEEIAWDEEFADTKESNDFATTVSDLLALAIKIPMAIVQMPINLLPHDTRRHARSAVREGFLAARSLVGAIGDGIESILSDPSDSATPVSGPPGTWGTARHAGGPKQSKADGSAEAGPGKVKRIEIEDEEAPPGEGRGLRADIDY
ncbi:MAG: hypothetical protein ABIO92_08155 [Chloroflexia bacterium]